MKKRILSMLLAIVMVVGLLPPAVFAAEAAAAATRVIYVDESTFFASGYSRFYDANENLLTATREEQEDGWVKYTMPADAKYYLTFDGHMGGGGGGNYPELPTNADTYDPFSDTWSCSHPGYAEGNCRLCGEPCPGHTYDNACDDKCNVCSEIREVGGHVYDNACDASCNNCDDIREVGDHVYDGAEDAECNECGYVRDITPAQITGVSIVIDGEEYVGSDTSAENPAVITSEAASVILTVHGTNLQYATDEQWVSYMSTGNCVTLDNSDWTKSEDGSLASLDLTFLTENFTQSVSVWEIKYSNDGGGLEDAVTGLYVKYEHIPEEEPIVIIQQPTDGEAKLGERYCVEVIAQGEGLKYQWYFRNEGASSFSKSSVTDSTYDDVMTKARMNRQVYCVITDSHGNSVTTDTASLIALKSVDLAITKEPESVTANYGERFTVTAEAVGDGVTYEWYYLDPDGAAWLSANVRSATYSATMSGKIDGRAVYCVARDIWGNQVATNAVFLSCERAELAITKQPNDASAKLGERFNVEVIAQGDGLKYQWYFRNKGATHWTKSSVTDNTYDDVMNNTRDGREVYCVITDEYGNSVKTDTVTLIQE